MKRNVPVSRHGPKMQNWISSLAVAMFLTLLVGSLVIVLNLAHQNKNAITAHTANHTSNIASFSNQTNTSLSQLGVYVGSSDGALYKLDAQSGTFLWRYQTNGRSIPAPPTVAAGTVYIGSQDGFVYALNASNGTLKWRFQTKAPVLASTTVDSNVVYAGSSDGYLYALHAQDGTLAWRYYTGPNTTAVTANSAVVAGGVVYGSSTDNVAHSYLFALDAKTGTQIWRIQVNNQTFTTPQVANGSIYIDSSSMQQAGGSDSTDSYVYAYRSGDGKQLWRSDKIGDYILSAPTVANGVVYIGSRDTFLYALDASTGHRIWHYHTGGAIYSSPQVINGVVYSGVITSPTANVHGASTDTTQAIGSIVAVNAAKGSLLWQHAIANYAGSALVAYQNALFVGSQDNFVFSLNTANGSEFWRYQEATTNLIFANNAPITVAP